MSFNVFVSHSMRPVDLPLLRGVVEHLSHYGISYYLAERDWRFGESLPLKVESAIRRADCVLAFLTKDGEASAYVNQEVSLALSAKKAIIPVSEKGADLSAFRAGMDYIELDRDAPQDCATKLTTRLNQLTAPQDVRSAMCWAVIATAGLMFLGRG
jgi:hypothetical protein